MKKLTIQMLVKNHEKTVEETIQSVLPLQAKLVVFDTGSKDNTLSICDKYGADIRIAKDKDRSKIRNSIKEEGWHLCIEPWEILAYGGNEILDIKEDGSYTFQVFRGDLITKEIRLWNNNILFHNPVCECLIDKKSRPLNVVLYSDFENKNKEIKQWMEENPAKAEPYYYMAMVSLSENKIENFIFYANQYLFRDLDKIIPITMTRFYMAYVYCHFKNDAATATKYLLPCIVTNPLMAEFWCLLGDIYFEVINNYNKAKVFYNNAIELGKNRMNGDKWPMELSKYKDYPLSKINQCNQIIKNTVYLGISPSID